MSKPGLEVIDGATPEGPIRAAVFDFDDTLSLLRSGWQEVMIQQALQALTPHSSAESPQSLRKLILQYIDELTGRPTIHQMARLADEVTKRGGKPLEAEAYKSQYLARLNHVINQRTSVILAGGAQPSSMHVPGAETLVRSLRDHDLTLVLASGTDDEFVQREMRLLNFDSYFGPHIYGAPANDPSFSKGRVLDEMVSKLGFPGREFVGFGDGVVEIREMRRVGGFAVGVAKWSAENPADFERHRRRLIEAGAQAIIPNYEDLHAILGLIGLEEKNQKC